MTKMVPVSSIKDNPFRDKKRNPIDSSRVDALVESINATDFWKGVYGRKVDDSVEIAFGHHRVDAARKAGLKEIPIEVMDLSDSDMLMRMTRENLRGELLSVIEAVSAAVKAFGAGTVQFTKVDPSTRKAVIRYAPSFVPEKEPNAPGALRPYTADTLAGFLGGVYVKPDGCAQNSVRAALGVLEMEERKVKGFSDKILQVNGAGPDGRYVGAKKIIEIVSGLKRQEIKVQERAEKSAEEIAAEKAKQEKLAADIKARQEREKKECEELLSKRVEAAAEENAKEVQRIADEIIRKAKAAEAKAEEDKAKLAALEASVEAKRAAAVEQRKEDEYLPIRREADRIVHALERRDLEEQVKALSRRALNPQDRERLRQAALTAGEWYSDWVAKLFLPPITDKRSRVKKEKK